MQAIVTKFISPTDHRSARIKATCQARSITLSWDHALNPAKNHRFAAQNLATQLGWDGRWIEGGLPDGSSVWTLDTFVADTFTIEAPPAPERDDPHAICRKWVARLGLGFHPDTRSADYTPELSVDECKEYDNDMESLFTIASDPYECALLALQDAGLD